MTRKILLQDLAESIPAMNYFNPFNIEGAEYDSNGKLIKGLFYVGSITPWNSKGIFDLNDKQYDWAISMNPTSKGPDSKSNYYAFVELVIPNGFNTFRTTFLYSRHLKEQTEPPTTFLQPGTFRGRIYVDGNEERGSLEILNGRPNPNIGKIGYFIEIDISRLGGKKIRLEVDCRVDISRPSPSKNWADHGTWVNPEWVS